MVRTCAKCSQANPTEALYCYRDGTFLDGGPGRGPLSSGTQPLHATFVFPSGRTCQNFDQLALACQELWPEAVSLLRQGYFENFLSGLGRSDLAQAARAGAQFPDPDCGLDGFLGRLPTQVLEGPGLQLLPGEIHLGQLRVGQERRLELHLANAGMRILHGSVSCGDSFWLSVGHTPGQREQLFVTRSEVTVPLHVHGKYLRAGIQPFNGAVLVESNGGKATVPVRVEVPVVPFREGVLAGATTPRQIAERARKAPKQAAVLFENGAVADWYQLNGWTYPVPGTTASGLAAVQQFFEALGLTVPPRVSLDDHLVILAGRAGDRLEHALRVKAQENRAVYANATSNQWWLQVGPPHLAGRTATIPLVVPHVPYRPGEVLHAEVQVTANGNQRFTVPVTLAVDIFAEAIPTVLDGTEEVVPVVPASGVGRQPRSPSGEPRRHGPR